MKLNLEKRLVICIIIVLFNCAFTAIVFSKNASFLLDDKIVNVRQLGAKGDGITNDTAIFEKAVQMAKNSILLVPKGNYLIEKNIFADNISKVLDYGNYTNIKPVYKSDNVVQSWNDFHSVKRFPISVGYSAAQGFCYNSKLKKFVLAVINKYDTVQQLWVINPRTWEIEKRLNFTGLGHCNTLAYCAENNIIYAVTMLDKGINKQVALLDGTNLKILKTINLPDSMAQLKYDPVCKLFVSMQNYGNTRGIKIYDSKFNKLREYILNMGQKTVANGGLVNNGNILMFTFAYMGEVDALGQIKKVIEMERSIEVEDGDFANGMFFVVANHKGMIEVFAKNE